MKTLLKEHAEVIDHLVWKLIDIVESTEKQFINTSDQRGKDVIYCYVYHDGFDELQELVCNGIALFDGVLCVLPTQCQNDFITDEEALESTDWLSLEMDGYLFEIPTLLSIAESIEEYVK
jgi:thymidylate synthase ThyX